VNIHRLGLASAVLAVAFVGSAQAATVQNTKSGSVAVINNGTAGQVFPNILLSGTDDRSNYLIFDLTTLAGQLAGQSAGSATLTLTSPGFYSTPDATENYSLWDFSGDVTALQTYGFATPPNATVAAAVRDDLRSGTLYGSTVISKPVSGGLPNLVITLNAAALAAINSTLGAPSKFFVIGGFSDSLTNGGLQYLFQSSSGGPGIASLDVQPVPLPAALWLVGSGLMGLGTLRRRSLAVA
jgi:hypothetical protein